MLGKNAEGCDRDEEWKRELRIMLMLNIKAEIQILGSGGALGDWLDKKLLGTI
jgi:meiotic recombination protein SPO11